MSDCRSTGSPAPPPSPSSSGSGPATATPSWWPRCGTASGSAGPADPGRPAGGHRRGGRARRHRRRRSGACWSTRGRVVTTHHHPDGSIQASEANAGGAEVYIGLRLDVGRPPLLDRLLRRVPLLLPRRATAGRAPAGARCPPALGLPDGGSRGMSLPLLRETRMPAVICEIGPASVRGRAGRRHRPGRRRRTGRMGRHRLGLRRRVRSNRRPPPDIGLRTVIHNLMHRLWITLYHRLRDQYHY